MRPTLMGGAAQSVTLWLFIILGIILVIGALSATSLRDMFESKLTPAAAPLPLPRSTSEAPSNAAPQSEPEVFGIEQLRAVFSVLGEAERAKLLADENEFSKLVENERARWSVLQAARSSGLESSPKVKYLMERSAEQVLLDTYVKLNVGAAVTSEFPTEAQIGQFYEQNQAKYQVDARVPVWQIFLALPKDADETQVVETERRAETLVAALRAGKEDFATAAVAHSQHESSRQNGGFMGNLKVTELIPEVKSAVLEAEVGKISGPVRSDAGLHILKRGQRIEATTLTLGQAREQIRAALRRAAETKVRQFVVQRASGGAGDAITDAQLARWRAALSETRGAGQ